MEAVRAAPVGEIEIIVVDEACPNGTRKLLYEPPQGWIDKVVLPPSVLIKTLDAQKVTETDGARYRELNRGQEPLGVLESLSWFGAPHWRSFPRPARGFHQLWHGGVLEREIHCQNGACR